MDALLSILKTLGLILVVIAFFNITIFVHELGHFLAARWRGLYVDRFQVWFGKPIWKKKINGVTYGLGTIPAGGFVSLPQMAPMQSVEGKVETDEPLPPVKPLDKIIVAAAGPAFSFMLAVVFATVVWIVGKPTDLLETRTVGYVEEGSPAAEAGLQAGDEIIAVDGEPVVAWQGNFQSIFENIIFSENEEISFTVNRPGVAEPLELQSKFKIPESSWWERSNMRQVGIAPESSREIEEIMEASPAEKAGLQPGDVIVEIAGEPVFSRAALSAKVEEVGTNPIDLLIRRGDQTLNVSVTPEVPKVPGEGPPMIGISYALDDLFNVSLTHPSPWQQIKGSANMMWVTITKVIAPGSSVGVEHLSGPVGIAKAKYDLLNTEDGLRRILWFTVFFNINLGILNLLPFPVLDGGHITMALLEMIKGRPVSPAILEKVQGGFAVLLIGFMLFVTAKDLGMFVPQGGGDSPRREISFK